MTSVDTLDFARSKIRDVPDFPRPGILFKDITPLLASPRAFHIVLDALAERFIGEHIDAIVGIEARGFIFGAALAARLNCSFVPARKPGRLPGDTDSVRYDTEYSTASLEMHRDSIVEESRVVVVTTSSPRAERPWLRPSWCEFRAATWWPTPSSSSWAFWGGARSSCRSGSKACSVTDAVRSRTPLRARQTPSMMSD